MLSNMIRRFFTCVLASLYFCLSSGSYQPETLPDIRDAEFIEECVRMHNRFRSGVNPPASNMLYMSWDPDLAKTAKGWAKRCEFKHNIYLQEPGQAHPRFTPVGENLWTGSLSIFSVQEAISSWYSEVGDYTYASNRCSRVCGHYTQVVWAQSYKVGCAVHFCPTVLHFSGTNAAHFVCNYGPAAKGASDGCQGTDPRCGNIYAFICRIKSLGQCGNYRRHPYETGAACSKCNGEQCTDNLCRNTERDKVISDSRWHPAWDSPACDEYCISVVVLRLLLLVLTIIATWILPKYWSIAPATK